MCNTTSSLEGQKDEFLLDTPAVRAFIADVLGFAHVDAGGGWLIFGLPPAELAVHPAESAGAVIWARNSG